MAKKKMRKNSGKKSIGTLIALVIAVFGYIFLDGTFSNPNNTAPVYVGESQQYSTQDTVSVISVGQADSALISSGGKFCLIDAGQTAQTSDDTVTGYLDKMGVKEIELAVITHFHQDHISEIADVLNNYKVNKILIPNLTQENIPTSKTFSEFMDIVEQQGIELLAAKKGDKYTVGNGELIVLDDTYNDLGTNSTSVATLFVQGDFTFLNTGDGETEYEQRLANCINQNVTLFTAGHHGSSTSNTEVLLSIIKPQFTAVSAGRDNSYGHPHQEAMEVLKTYSGQVDVTMDKGTLVYSINDKTLIS